MAQQAKPQGWNLVESNHSLTFRKRKTFLYEQREMFTAVYERKQRTPKGKPHIFHCIEHLRTGKHQALGFYEAGGCGYELHISRCKRWYMTTNDYKVEAGEKIVTCPHQLFTDEVLSESRGVSSMIAASAAKYLQDELLDARHHIIQLLERPLPSSLRLVVDGQVVLEDPLQPFFGVRV